MTIDSLDPEESANHRLEKWREWDHCPPNGAIQSPNEQLPNGANLPQKRLGNIKQSKDQSRQDWEQHL